MYVFSDLVSQSRFQTSRLHGLPFSIFNVVASNQDGGCSTENSRYNLTFEYLTNYCKDGGENKETR